MKEAAIDEQKARVVLADGQCFDGYSFGYPQSIAGEIVFTTGMTGYPEALSDPSYFGQILVFTFPLIGNYGMPEEALLEGLKRYYESDQGQIRGLVVADYSANYAHWNARNSLTQWLYDLRIPAVTGVDTRALTRHIRTQGVMPAKLIIGQDVDFADPNENNLVKEVSIKEPRLYGSGRKRILLIDCGCKHSIIQNLLQRDVQILRVPWDFDVDSETYDGVIISSGPGDPKQVGETVQLAKRLIEKQKPTFGICLGHQVMALAAGADSYKLKFGHRSQNQPVQVAGGGKAYVTSQNHGYAVDPAKLPPDWKPWFINLNDGTNEGLMHESGRFFTTQFHPEASPGPVDTTFLFDQFVQVIHEPSS
ncbi:MAG: glutamine-hydrolyzing carbamoyl-phosphate synthase small subunit [Caldithrix sp.]|nr:glutamine-hydrolyzing carbamoyl-phosphate synthase small subunit [Caldithrix sp.]